MGLSILYLRVVTAVYRRSDKLKKHPCHPTATARFTTCPSSHNSLYISKARRHSGARLTLHCLSLSIPHDYKYPAKSNIKKLACLVLCIKYSITAISGFQREVYAQQRCQQQAASLVEYNENRYTCSFICKMVIHCSRQEQHRAESFTRSLPLLHLLQKQIKTLHIFSTFILGILRTS